MRWNSNDYYQHTEYYIGKYGAPKSCTVLVTPEQYLDIQLTADKEELRAMSIHKCNKDQENEKPSTEVAAVIIGETPKALWFRFLATNEMHWIPRSCVVATVDDELSVIHDWILKQKGIL